MYNMCKYILVPVVVAVEDAGENAVNVTAHVLVSLLTNGLC